MSQPFTFMRFRKLKGFQFSLYILLLLTFFMVFLSPRDTFAAQGTLSWDATTTYTDGTPLTDPGYYVYYRTASSNYSDSNKQNTYATTYLVNNFGITYSDTYCFAVKAYDIEGHKSDYSNEVCENFIKLTIDKSGSGTVTGLGINCGSVCTEL